MHSNSNFRTTLLTPEQVADILQIHILTVYSYIRQGKLNAVRLGRCYRITPDDLDRLIQSSRVNYTSCKKMVRVKDGNQQSAERT